MSGNGLFLAGVAVTMVVTAALALLVWGAILDGRDRERGRISAAEDPQLPAAGVNVRSLPERVPPHAA